MVKKQKQNSPESIYVLKLLLFVIIGSQWIYLGTSPSTGQLPIPVGFLLGLVFARHEHFKIDRKIAYAVLLIAMFAGFWLPMGLTITL